MGRFKMLMGVRKAAMMVKRHDATYMRRN